MEEREDQRKKWIEIYLFNVLDGEIKRQAHATRPDLIVQV